jgi:hypothetical protein
MRMHWMAAVGVVIVGLLGACSRSSSSAQPDAQPDAQPLAPAPSEPAATARPVASETAASRPISSDAPARMTAPLRLIVKGPLPVPEKGSVKVTAEIVANEPISLPAKLKITVPPEAKIVSGNAEESLQVGDAGTLTRDWSLQLSGKLSAPVVVTVDTRDASGGFGLHAERRYPPDPTPEVSSSRPPPAGRPPAPPR